VFDFCRSCEKCFTIYFGHYDDVIRPQIGVVHAQRNYATIVNGGVARDNLFNVLRIDIFAADNEQVFLPADHEQFAFEMKSEIARVVPAIDDRVGYSAMIAALARHRWYWIPPLYGLALLVVSIVTHTQGEAAAQFMYRRF
jgi:hypothetical protein